MTTREDLEKLAIACEQCASKDPASFDKHLEKCPVCNKYKIEAEKINYMMEAVKKLASKPDEERRKILGTRIEQYSTTTEEQRIMAVSEMLDAVGELSEDGRI